MCFSCWEEHGTPRIDTPIVRDTAKAIEAVYEFSAVGGNLHVVIDDWNLGDQTIHWCGQVLDGGGVMPDDGWLADCHQRYNDEKRANPDPPDQLKAERYCCDLLLTLTEEERASALGLWEGFWKP